MKALCFHRPTPQRSVTGKWGERKVSEEDVRKREREAVSRIETWAGGHAR